MDGPKQLCPFPPQLKITSNPLALNADTVFKGVGLGAEKGQYS